MSDGYNINQSHARKRSQPKKPAKSKQTKDRVYHDIEVSALAMAFQNQFFKHFDQSTRQTTSAGDVQVYQGDSLTVASGKVKFEELLAQTNSEL